MKENEARRLLLSLLDGEGVEWIEESGWIRFLTRHDAMLWETACRACDGALLIYGSFPFRASETDHARRTCEEINRSLVRGALYLAEDGMPVYRCRAELDDIYGAEDRIRTALHYSAQVITCFWARLAGA